MMDLICYTHEKHQKVNYVTEITKCLLHHEFLLTIVIKLASTHLTRGKVSTLSKHSFSNMKIYKSMYVLLCELLEEHNIDLRNMVNFIHSRYIVCILFVTPGRLCDIYSFTKENSTDNSLMKKGKKSNQIVFCLLNGVVT